MSRRAGFAASAATALVAAGLLAGPGAGPLAAQDLVIRGGTVHTLAGEPTVADVLVRGGVIESVAPGAAVPAGATVIDASGLHVYPGLFDAVTRLGLTEIGAVDVTNDMTEQGDFNPHLQARTAIHPASEHIPVARANGITHTVVAPTPGGGWRSGPSSGFPGQGSLVSLDGWTVEEMDLEPAAAMMLAWPQVRTFEFDFQTFSRRDIPFSEAREEYDEAVARIGAWMDAAREYAQAKAGGYAATDLKLEALTRVLDGDMPVVVSADGEREIRDAVEWAREQGVRMILAEGAEAWKVADLLAERDVPVILGPTQAVPDHPDAPYDRRFTAPGVLHRAGVDIAFATFDASDSRTLPYEAAMAVPYGLPRDEALRAITVNAAEMLGVGDRLGTVEPGKVANLVVTDGDPLVLTTEVRHLVIDGREVSTMNRHRELYEQYRSRPAPGGRGR